MSCSVFDNFEFSVLFSAKTLYKPSALCYNAICKIVFAVSVRVIQYNIIRIMFPPPIQVAFLYYEPHIFQLLLVFRAGGYDINSCGIYA